MNWKKLFLIAVVAGGFAFAAAPRSEAHLHVGIGFGFPVGYGGGYYGCPGPVYYPYGYGYAPYGYYGSRVAISVGPRYYWSHGRRVYYPARSRYRRWR